jgi:hypothetical protein
MSYSIAFGLSETATFRGFRRPLLTIQIWPKILNIRLPKQTRKSMRARIDKLEDKLSRAEVIDVSQLSGDIVKFGATVTLIEGTLETRRYGRLLASQKQTRTKEKFQ